MYRETNTKTPDEEIIYSPDSDPTAAIAGRDLTAEERRNLRDTRPPEEHLGRLATEPAAAIMGKTEQVPFTD